MEVTDDLVEKVARAIIDTQKDGTWLDAARAALSAIEEAGWCVAPKEATDNMIRAAVFSHFNGKSNAQAYASMLSARPRITGGTE